MSDKSIVDGQDSVELFRSNNVLVRKIEANSTGRWVITFDHHSIGEGFDRPGFCEKMLYSMGISAIHVLGRGNDWYQYDDIFDALATVRNATAGALRRITYGSSMGGYAAIRLADAVGADGMLALSPQWSINPARARWENRWPDDSPRIRWLDAIDGPLRCQAMPTLIYDPHLPLDRRHVAKIAAETPSVLVPVPYSGHPSAPCLSETGLLRLLIEDTLHDGFDAQAFVAEIRARRSKSAVYLCALAERQPDVRPRMALALARAGCALYPNNASAMLSVARILARNGDHVEALAMHREIVSLTGRLLNYLVPFSEALLRAGEKIEAMAIAKEVTDTAPGIAHLGNWRAALLWKCGKRSEAVREQKRAIALVPKNYRYRINLFEYRIGQFRWCLMYFVQRFLKNKNI